MRAASFLLLTFLGGAAATGVCQSWCSKWTCGVTDHCGGCTAANKICMSNRPCPPGFASECSVGSTVLAYPHKMCNEMSFCQPFCTCDDAPPAVTKTSSPPPLPPSPPSVPQLPPAACDVEAMGQLKTKLAGMIATQKDKNSKLQIAAYPSLNFPLMPPQPPSLPPAPSPLGSCAKKWGQCGGKNHKGATCCQTGSCVVHNPWYSQCRD